LNDDYQLLRFVIVKPMEEIQLLVTSMEFLL